MIVLVDDELIDAEVGGEGAAAGEVEVDRVGVRFGLPRLDGAAPLVLGEAGALAEWCGIARVLHDLKSARIGHMGHVLESMLDMHTHKFNEALSVHNSLGHIMDPKEATGFYLRTIPEAFVLGMQTLPRSVRAAHVEILRMSKLQSALRGYTNTSSPKPLKSIQEIIPNS